MENVEKRQENPRSGITPPWLEQDRSRCFTTQGTEEVLSLVFCPHQHQVFMGYGQRGPFQGRFNHRPIAQEGAELLRRVGAEMFSNEPFQPLTLSTSENNAPQI